MGGARRDGGHGGWRDEEAVVTAGVAAGHPTTTEVGLRLLTAGGTAGDAAVAAVLASCVAETVLTGLGGGGFATYFDAATGRVTCLDFFCTVPGVDRDAGHTARPMRPVEISFGGVPLGFSIGGATVAVPGVPAGLGELHRRFGRLPWHEVVAPSISLARSGVPLPAAQAGTLAAVAPALLPGDGASVYAPGGRLLGGGELLHHPGLDAALTMLAERGPAAYYTGGIGAALVDAVRAEGGVLGPDDLAAYRVLELPVESAALAGNTVHARRDLNRTVAAIAALPPTLTRLPAGGRAVAMADAMVSHGPQRFGCTTSLSVVDEAGDACVVTTTLGVGSGVWVPGTGIHGNSMLGEAELMSPGLLPGDRVPSNMCPLVVIDSDGDLVLAAGSAGASRIRSALVHTLVNVLVDEVGVSEAVVRPRFHVVADRADDPHRPDGPNGPNGPDGPDGPNGPGGAMRPLVHAEAGYPAAELAALEAAGYQVNRWDHRSHYFGGVSAVGTAGAAGDPRRGGVGALTGRRCAATAG
jgi:gamma-glutamyltranspeptidase/glutathione hydrolase